MWKFLCIFSGRENQSLLCRESSKASSTHNNSSTPVKEIQHTGHGEYKNSHHHNGHSCEVKDTYLSNSHAANCFLPKGGDIDRDFCNNLYPKERRDSNCNNLKYLAGGGRAVNNSPPPSAAGERNGAHSLERRMNANGRGAMTRSSTPTTTSSDSIPWMPPPPPPPPPNQVRPPLHQRPIEHSGVVDRPFVVNPNPVLFPHPISPPNPPSRVLPDPFQSPAYTSTTTQSGVFNPLAVYPPASYPAHLPHVSGSMHGTGSYLPGTLLPPHPEASYSLLFRSMSQQHLPQTPQHRLGIHPPAPSRGTDSPVTYYHRTRPSPLDAPHSRSSPPFREEPPPADRRISPHQQPATHHHHHHHHSVPRALPGSQQPGHHRIKQSPMKLESSGISQHAYGPGPSKYGPHYDSIEHRVSAYSGASSSSTSGSSGNLHLIKPSVKVVDELVPPPKKKRDNGGDGTTSSIVHQPDCVMTTSSTSSSVTSAQSSSQPHYPPHFTKGSVIQLANGVLKRVEDLRTEDFVNSADISADLKIDSSQVVHIEEIAEKETAILGFSVGEQKIRVSIQQ